MLAIEEPVSFGRHLHPDTDRRLQIAVLARRRDPLQAERLFWEAQTNDPTCLPVYFALYKFYANRKRLPDAERAARLALAEAARQGGFSPDWRILNASKPTTDLYATEPGRFYLFSLKALGFLKLRQQQAPEAEEVLTHLRRLDPEDRSGGSVVRTLAESLGISFEDSAHDPA